MEKPSRISPAALRVCALSIALTSCAEHAGGVGGRDVVAQGQPAAERTRQDSIAADSARRARVARVPTPEVL